VPEAMAIQETSRYFATLQRHSVPVTHLITNRVEQPHHKCSYCAARVAAQIPYLQQITSEFSDLNRHFVPVFPQEIRGSASLRDFAKRLWGVSAAVPSPGVAQETTKRRATVPMESGGGNLLKTKRVLIVGGKGGTGKTTTAAALAIHLAEKNANQRFLVFSTDPAHSLTDSFAEPIGEFRNGVAGLRNLDAIEINAVSKFDQLKDRYKRWIEEIFSSITGGSNWEVQFDRGPCRN
jgi:arsenite-transporting ATPase